MQVIKLIVLFIVSFISSLLIFAAILPSRYEISLFIEIERTKDIVFNTLKNLEERKVWYTLVDSNLVSTINVAGNGEKGSKFSWKNGEIEVITADIKKIENKIKFTNYPINAGFTQYKLNSTGSEYFDLIETAKRTTVTWVINGGPLEYPIGKVVNAAVKYKIYKEMEKSLFKLKDYIESTKAEEVPKENNIQIQPPTPQNTQQTEQPNPPDTVNNPN